MFDPTVFVGTAGADTWRGANFADHLYGSIGADVLVGLGGNDLINGDSGDDRLDGGIGNGGEALGAITTIAGDVNGDSVSDVHGTVALVAADFVL